MSNSLFSAKSNLKKIFLEHNQFKFCCRNIKQYVQMLNLWQDLIGIYGGKHIWKLTVPYVHLFFFINLPSKCKQAEVEFSVSLFIVFQYSHKWNTNFGENPKWQVLTLSRDRNSLLVNILSTPHLPLLCYKTHWQWKLNEVTEN